MNIKDNNLLQQAYHKALCRRNKQASSQSDVLTLHHTDIVGGEHALLATNINKPLLHFLTHF